MHIDGRTEVIAHLGYPTHTFKSPMIYNPYFEAEGINAVVVPFSSRPESFAQSLRGLFQMDNVRGTLTLCGMVMSAPRTLSISNRPRRLCAKDSALLEKGTTTALIPCASKYGL